METHQRSEFGRRATPPAAPVAGWSLSLEHPRVFAVGIAIAFVLGATLVVLIRHASRDVPAPPVETALPDMHDVVRTQAKSAEAGQ